PATTDVYPLSLHDALPICRRRETLPGAGPQVADVRSAVAGALVEPDAGDGAVDVGAELHAKLHRRRIGDSRVDRRGVRGKSAARSEEHTSELQSQSNLVCR